MWFNKKKNLISEVSKFLICPILKILESFLLLKFLVVYETQNLKTDLKATLSCGLRRKNANL